MSESQPQLIRLRLPGQSGFVYLLRHHGRGAEGYPGADQLETSEGKLLGADSPGLLLHQAGLPDRPQVHMLIIDLRRARRGLTRPSDRWSNQVRADLKQADDLFYDAAASLADQGMADATSGDTPFHRTYQYLWGNDVKLLPPAERVRLWDNHLQWLLTSLRVFHRH
ncbi:hypothetical protein [Kineosporia succinea]|uniref:Uncharacterized protein n=1 Tax=Kineosporia succinea TaxID=84632 RepID=A0ABT9PDI3_9ACTN|nr:hypothetical protein [Kineosporia succinea]MDP9830771.1 hypothetical protein [Kineosporia succinea]